MPAVQHPRLAELDRLAAEAEANPVADEAPIASETTAEALVSPEVETPAVEAREPEEDYFLQLDKRNPYQSLRDLATREKAVNDAIETMAGRRGKARYGPELDALRAERDALKAEIKHRDYEKLTGEEVTRRFGEDSEFAHEYTDLVHRKQVDPAAIHQEAQEKVVYNNDLLFAEQQGVPLDNLAKIENWVQTGAFKRHPDGRPMSPLDSYRWFREVVENEINAARIVTASQQQQRVAVQNPPAAPAPVAAAEKRTPTPNPKLQEASPDLSASSHSPSGIQRMSREEWHNMNPIERMQRWPSASDFQREVNAGLFKD